MCGPPLVATGDLARPSLGGLVARAFAFGLASHDDHHALIEGIIVHLGARLVTNAVTAHFRYFATRFLRQLLMRALTPLLTERLQSEIAASRSLACRLLLVVVRLLVCFVESFVGTHQLSLSLIVQGEEISFSVEACIRNWLVVLFLRLLIGLHVALVTLGLGLPELF